VADKLIAVFELHGGHDRSRLVREIQTLDLTTYLRQDGTTVIVMQKDIDAHAAAARS
jgi:hypothetical protein